MTSMRRSSAVSPGSELARMRDAGEHIELNEREMLQEEPLLLNSLDADGDCFLAAIPTTQFLLAPISLIGII